MKIAILRKGKDVPWWILKFVPHQDIHLGVERGFGIALGFKSKTKVIVFRHIVLDGKGLTGEVHGAPTEWYYKWWTLPQIFGRLSLMLTKWRHKNDETNKQNS
jgi:hypothetical protein